MITEREVIFDRSLKDSNPTAEVPFTPSKLEGEVKPDLLSTTTDAVWKDRVEGVVNESIETASSLCDPSDTELNELSTLLTDRDKDFKSGTPSVVDTTKVDKYVSKIYGKNTSGEELNTLIDRAIVTNDALRGIIDVSGDRSTKRAFLKDSIKLALATGSPREVNMLLKGLKSGEISLKTRSGNLTTPAKLLLSTANLLENNQYTTASGHSVQHKIKSEIRNHIEDPRDTTKKTAFQNAVSGISKIKVTSTPDQIKTTEWICKTSGENKDKSNKLFKGLLNRSSGPLLSMSSGTRDVIEEELSTFNKTPLDKLNGQIKTIKEITAIAKDSTKSANVKIKDIETKLNDRNTRKELGNIFETIDANISIENPKHKEALARRSVEMLNQIVEANNVELANLSTPWNTTWEEEFRKATVRLNEDGNIMKAADLLGRVAIFGPRADLRKTAEKELQTLLVSLLIHQGQSRDKVLDILKNSTPATYGAEMKKLFTDTTSGLGLNPDNTSVSLASTIFQRLDSISYFKSINNKTGQTAKEVGQIGVLTTRLHNSEGSVFDINKDVDPDNFSPSDLEKIGDSLQELVQKDAIAEVLDLENNDPLVAEIIGMSSPSGILETENRKFNRINKSEMIRKAGAAGMFATGIVLSTNPATAPIGVGILAATTIVKGVGAIRNIVQSSRRIGFPKTIRNLVKGIGKSFTFLFDKERTTTEKATYLGSAALGAARMLLPGIGSAVYSIAEAGAVIGSEAHLSKIRKDTALEVAALKVMINSTSFRVPNNASGSMVNVPQIWKEYKIRRDALLEIKRREAIQSGENVKPIDSYSDREVLEIIKDEKFKAGPHPNTEADFIATMEELITRQETIKKLNEKYNKAAGLWGAAFAGHFVGNILGGIGKVAYNKFNDSSTPPVAEAQEEVVTEESPLTEPQEQPEAEIPQDTITEGSITPESGTVTLPEYLDFKIYNKLQRGLNARGMEVSKQGGLHINSDWSPGGWADYQRQAAELIVSQGIELNSEASGFAIAELAAQAIYNNQSVNVENLTKALQLAASRGLN
jgi:hypothetical protein